ncbi:HlyD family efflux transporter periplasmic adaptor subunit [Altererythrobacter endophyticus]|uniref:HlyD family efflux transporter periplasmic adaptor subunit n=2 Tax=Altericroceibacterium endophyticum TaxID=1808508 RepID=A0A6I4T3Z7_9SPHN|nr:HlyD family efflux transporter periplasmic adaptor subunit [Altericroceibacterium endophyticum]
MDRRVERKRAPLWRDKRLLIALAVVAIGIVGWRAIPASGSTNVDAGDIQTGEVTRAAFDDYLPVRASVVPATTTLVGVMSGGQVEDLFVQDGALVTKGQPLARLANPDLELTVLSQEAHIASQLGGVAGENLAIQRSRVDRAGQVAAAEYDLVRARRELDIRQQLHDKGFVSDAGVKSYQEEVDYQSQRLAQLQSGRAAEAGITARQGQMLDATRARLQSNLTAVRGSLDALTIRAPMAGRLTNFTLQPGQTLAPGDPAGQVDSEGAWKLEADVDEYYLGRVEVGQKAATSGGATLTVSKVLPTVTDGRFRGELTFEQLPKQDLNRGQTLDVRITLGAAKPALIAPAGGWLTEGGSSVFVVDPDGKHAHRVAITIGRRNPRQVEILSGLEPGQRIVTSNLARVKGDTINIR